jgi:hypothetical protein
MVASSLYSFLLFVIAPSPSPPFFPYCPLTSLLTPNVGPMIASLYKTVLFSTFRLPIDIIFSFFFFSILFLPSRYMYMYNVNVFGTREKVGGDGSLQPTLCTATMKAGRIATGVECESRCNSLSHRRQSAERKEGLSTAWHSLSSGRSPMWQVIFGCFLFSACTLIRESHRRTTVCALWPSPSVLVTGTEYRYRYSRTRQWIMLRDRSLFPGTRRASSG